MRNKFTALALILIAIISAANEGSADSGDQASDVMDADVSATSEMADVPEASEEETITEKLTIETAVSGSVTEVSETEPEYKSFESYAEEKLPGFDMSEPNYK